LIKLLYFVFYQILEVSTGVPLAPITNEDIQATQIHSCHRVPFLADGKSWLFVYLRFAGFGEARQGRHREATDGSLWSHIPLLSLSRPHPRS
jgi:hypothetical protein